MADKRISELTALTGANSADDDLLVIVDSSASETKSITLGELEKALGERDFSFADDDKLVFGDGDDLQIYHDGSASYIKDGGTGPLNIQGEELVLENPDGTNYFRAATDGSVKLYNSGNLKLNTQSTGIDVTGTVTADGLTVDAGGSSPATTLITTGTGGGTQPTFVFHRNTDLLNDNAQVGLIQWKAGTAPNTVAGIYVDHVGTSENAARMEFYTSEAGNFRERMLIDNNGDISFYEDTGTTAKFFWDASAESLGIGTSSPNTTVPLTIEGSTSGIQFTDSDLEGNWNIVVNGGNFRIQQGNVGSAPTEAMRLDASGNVGIGNGLSASNPTGGAYSIADPDSKTIVDVLRVGEDDGGTIGVSEIQIVGYGSNTDSGGGTLRFLNSRYSSTVAMIKGTRESPNEGYLKFYTGNTSAISEAMRIDSSGNLDLTNGGGNIIMASGAGIDFSATANSSGTMSNELLDDYEEGTWTPVFTGWSTTGTTSVAGKYTKVGNVVVVTGQFRSVTGSIASTGGTSTVTGLPFSISGHMSFTMSPAQGATDGGVGANSGDTLYAPTISSTFNDIYFQATYHTS